jgi:hypothetical protein
MPAMEAFESNGTRELFCATEVPPTDLPKQVSVRILPWTAVSDLFRASSGT